MSIASTLYILLPVFNRKTITLQFVQQLKGQTNQNFQLILIDDGSTDGTSSEVNKVLPEVTVLRGGDLWWGGSLQLAIDHLKEKDVSSDCPILIMNDDTIVGSTFLEQGLKALETNEDSLICASNRINGTLYPSTVHINWKEFSFRTTDKELNSNCLPTRGLFLRFGDILKIGEFRPRLLPHYFSDYEFTHRAYTKGYKLISPKEFWLESMPQETGIRSLTGKGTTYLKKLFSIRYTNNPPHTAMFILLAAPGIYKLTNLIKLFVRTVRQIVKNL